jgi:hypothetical protein
MFGYESNCKHLQTGDRKALYGLFVLFIIEMIFCYLRFGGEAWITRLAQVVVGLALIGALAALIDARWEAAHKKRRRVA